jgi:hypothetical protein
VVLLLLEEGDLDEVHQGLRPHIPDSANNLQLGNGGVSWSWSLHAGSPIQSGC